MSPLQRPTSQCCLGKQSLLIVRTIWNTQIIYKHPVLTSQEIHYISPTKTSWLMLFGKAVTVYFENYRKHKYTLWAECRVLMF
jgi:hypothetical protein